MATFESLAEANPDIREQYDDWREARASNGEDAADYGAFRQHVRALGGPDPGATPPDDWVGSEYEAEHSVEASTEEADAEQDQEETA